MIPVQPPPKQEISERQRALLLSIRQALRMILGAIEDYMGMERTHIPNHKRKEKG